MSIRDNIKASHPSATFEEVEDASKKAYAHDFIEAFPDGKFSFTQSSYDLSHSPHNKLLSK
jgi:ABC-type multidrug transport system fused ATPase/permease subunit